MKRSTLALLVVTGSMAVGMTACSGGGSEMGGAPALSETAVTAVQECHASAADAAEDLTAKQLDDVSTVTTAILGDDDSSGFVGSWLAEDRGTVTVAWNGDVPRGVRTRSEAIDFASGFVATVVPASHSLAELKAASERLIVRGEDGEKLFVDLPGGPDSLEIGSVAPLENGSGLWVGVSPSEEAATADLRALSCDLAGVAGMPVLLEPDGRSAGA